jgi:hypothetical protein
VIGFIGRMGRGGNLMARSASIPWEELGARAAVEARRPEEFIRQHVSPLFFRDTRPADGNHERFDSDKAFWSRSGSFHLASIRLTKFRLSDWFPRAPGVYWSEYGIEARELTWAGDAANDPKLGRIFSPESKMTLIEQGGIGTIRLRPRRIDDTDCWLATAVSGRQCAGGIPLALPHSFLQEAKTAWGDTVTIHGQIRFLQDAGLDDAAASVHHASPIIVFVDKIESLPRRKQSTPPITITPVVLFERGQDDESPRRRRLRNLGYTFVQCVAGAKNGINEAAEWLGSYAEKFDGQVITNFDERCPTLADAPLSYQRLVEKKYDRTIIERLYLNDGAKFAEKIDRVEAVVTEYNNYGQAAAFGENARSDDNRYAQSIRTEPSHFTKMAKRLGRLIGRNS